MIIYKISEYKCCNRRSIQFYLISQPDSRGHGMFNTTNVIQNEYICINQSLSVHHYKSIIDRIRSYQIIFCQCKQKHCLMSCINKIQHHNKLIDMLIDKTTHVYLGNNNKSCRILVQQKIVNMSSVRNKIDEFKLRVYSFE